jgi:signal transduction histidine kinase
MVLNIGELPYFIYINAQRKTSFATFANTLSPSYLMRILFLYIGLLVFMVTVIGNFAYAQSRVVSAAQSDRKIDSLNQLANKYALKSPRKARGFAIEALNIAKKNGSIEQQAASMLNIANTYKSARDYSNVLQTLNPLLTKLNEIENYDIIAEVLNSIGIAHYQLGHDTISLVEYIDESQLVSKQSDLQSISLSLKAIGRFYQKIGSHKKSIEFLTKSVRIDSLIGFPSPLGESLFLLAKGYVQLNNSDRAIPLLKQSIQHLKKGESSVLLTEAHLCLAEVLALENPFDSNKHLDSALNSREPIDSYRVNILLVNLLASTQNPDSALLVLTNLKGADSTLEKQKNFWEAKLLIAYTYYKLKKFKKAEIEFLAIINQSKELGLNRIALVASRRLSELYIDLGNTPAANKILLQHIRLRDEVEKEHLTNLNTSPASSLDRKLEAYQKEAKLQGLIIEKEETRRKLLLTLVIVTLPLLLLISLLLVGRIRSNKILAQRNRQIEQQNEELNAINEQLLLSQQKLLRLNQTKDKFFSIVAHDLKGPLVALKTLVFNIRQADSITNGNENVNLSALEEALSNTINLLNNLLYWALSQEDSIAFQPEKFNVSDCLTIEIANAKLIASHKSITLSIDVNSSLHAVTDPNMFLFIFRNFLSNALKFTPENGSISIKAIEYNHSLTISITDTGKGMSTEEVKLLFEITKNKLGGFKRSEIGTGLGLILSKEFAIKMGGTIEVKSEIGLGSVFTLKIPIRIA